MSEFAVIRTQLDPVNANLVREILTRAGGMAKVDAAQTARRQQGILGERFSEQQAHAIVEAFARMGLAFRVLPEEQIRQLPPAKTIQWIELGPEGIRIPVNLQGLTTFIPWSNIFVISAGHVAEVEQQRHETQKTKRIRVPGVASISVNLTDEEIVRNSRKTHVTEMICIDSIGEFLNLRITPARFRFDRVTPAIPSGSTHQRYLRVVEALTQYATQAVISHETFDILGRPTRGNSLSSGDYQAMIETQAFRERNTWLLQIAVLAEMERERNADPGGPEQTVD